MRDLNKDAAKALLSGGASPETINRIVEQYPNWASVIEAGFNASMMAMTVMSQSMEVTVKRFASGMIALMDMMDQSEAEDVMDELEEEAA
jgi:hypothetical protein